MILLLLWNGSVLAADGVVLPDATLLVYRQAFLIDLHELSLRRLNHILTHLADCQIIQGVALRRTGQVHRGEHAPVTFVHVER